LEYSSLAPNGGVTLYQIIHTNTNLVEIFGVHHAAITLSHFPTNHPIAAKEQQKGIKSSTIPKLKLSLKNEGKKLKPSMYCV
jgi:hypothetical protein